MSGFNTKNLIAQNTAISSSVAIGPFKIHEGDLDGLVIQINSAADPGTVTLDTSYDGGTSWLSINLTALAAYGSGLIRVRLPDTYFTGYQKLGPLARLRSSNSVTATAVWKTTVS